MELTDLAIDVEAQDAGVWIDLAQLPGVRVRTRGPHYPEYRRALAARLTPDAKRAAAISMSIDPVRTEEHDGEAIADHLLLEWSGLTVNGEPMPATRENKVKLLTDRHYLRFANAYKFELNEMNRLAIEAHEETSKN